MVKTHLALSSHERKKEKKKKRKKGKEKRKERKYTDDRRIKSSG